jgi:AraC family transcriptional regulator of adaptative response / DNA-3-methyladenine glycosylase II
MCYEIFRSKDARYDGRFFVGVLSTGIYCRPICRTRLPKPENCLYFRTAAEAERAGFRPCLLCRPELAPGSSPMDASSELARKAAYFLRDNCGSGLSLDELSRKLGCSGRHLRRVFEQEYHVTPIEYLQTCRLLLAKQLLTDTALSVLDISMAAGFGSVRRMNELFQVHYGLTPTALRRRAAEGALKGETVSVSLSYREPYDWDSLIAFLAPRTIPGIEHVEKGIYERVLHIPDRKGIRCRGVVRVGPDKKRKALRATISESLVPALPQVLAKVRQMFDLDCDPEIIASKLAVLEDVIPGGYNPGTRLPGCFDSFEMACRAIIGQQISVRAASTLSGRMAQACGEEVETGVDGLRFVFPKPQDILDLGDGITEKLGNLGIIASRSRAIQGLAAAMADGSIRLDCMADPEEEMERMQKIRGIGSWTAKYIAMRTMGWTDAFLETDAGIRKVLSDCTDRERLQMSEPWRPWRSYATMNIWNRYIHR